MSVKHQYISAVPDAGDASLVQPSNWNADHTVDDNTLVAAKLSASATNVLFGRSTSGSGAGEEVSCTAAGRAIIDDADASAQRTTLGLGTIATQNANNVSITGGAISGITDLAVADGGTGASSGRAAAANLSLAYILGKSAVAVAGANDTNENTLATINVPAGAMGANGAISIQMRFTLTSNANAKTIRVRLGGSGGDILYTESITNTGIGQIEVRIANVNATNVQKGASFSAKGSGSVIATALTSGAQDTTASKDLLITVQKGTGTDTMQLEEYTAILMSDGT